LKPYKIKKIHTFGVLWYLKDKYDIEIIDCMPITICMSPGFKLSAAILLFNKSTAQQGIDINY